MYIYICIYIHMYNTTLNYESYNVKLTFPQRQKKLWLFLNAAVALNLAG